MQRDLLNDFAKAEIVATLIPSGTPANISRKIEAMLKAFSVRGYLTTVEAERVMHRGQATIGEMRNRGHIVELTAVGPDGDAGYVYRGFTPGMKKVSPSIQSRYYKTKHWRQTAKARKEIDGFKCVQCKSTEELETHHWRYNLFAENIERDLITICKPCHKILHIDIKGSGVHFPRWMNDDLYERIEKESNDDDIDSDDGSEQSTGEGDDTSGSPEREGRSCSDENTACSTGALFQDSESGCRAEATSGAEGWDASF